MNNVDFSGIMKREELEQLVQPLLRSRATVPLEQALLEAKIKVEAATKSALQKWPSKAITTFSKSFSSNFFPSSYCLPGSSFYLLAFQRCLILVTVESAGEGLGW